MVHGTRNYIFLQNYLACHREVWVDPNNMFVYLQVMFERMSVENEERKVQRVSRVEGDQPPATAATTTITGTEDASDPRVMGRLDQERKNDRILELNQRLKKLNTYSSFLNILTLMLLKIHLIYLAQRLHLSS